MRNSHYNFSSIGNVVVSLVSTLIVRGGTLRSLCARLAALLRVILLGTLRHWPTETRGLTARPADCFVVTKQRLRQHDFMCCRSVA